MTKVKIFIPILLLLILQGCYKLPTKLPVLGKMEIIGGDTTFHQIPEFSFINQDSQVVNNATFEGKIYVADFFFTSCPTICPKVKAQVLRIYERFEHEDMLKYLSHSIDVRRDTVGRLKWFADKLEISSDRWHLITGDETEIYDIADDYWSVAIKDETSPGGFDHSGRLLLIDPQRRIRSYCEGTDAKDVDRFMEDIEILLDEYRVP